MKYHLLIFMFCLFIGNPCLVNGQQYDFLDINNIKARINSDGSLFNDFSTFDTPFEVPIGSGKSTIFSSSMWIGGIDVGGQLHLAAQTYKQSGEDFWPGTSIYEPFWTVSDRVWKITRAEIDAFKNWLNNPYPGYVIPDIILQWPGLCEFVDVDGNGVYEPFNGDYPEILGDQVILFIYNDDKYDHTESNGEKLGIQVCALAYAFDCEESQALDHTIFINYTISNKSPNTYSDVSVGMFTDFDLGNFIDDYTGSDVSRNSYYAYNGFENDSGVKGYGLNPPAQSLTFLKGPLADLADGKDNNRNGEIDEVGETVGMSKYHPYTAGFGSMGGPITPEEYFNYLNGRWKDSVPMTYNGTGYGGTLVSDFMFPGLSDDVGWGVGGSLASPDPQLEWSEVTEANIPADRHGIGSVGSFTLEADGFIKMDVAYVFGRADSGGVAASIEVMQNHIDSIQYYYDNQITPCGDFLSIEAKIKDIDYKIFPNPMTNKCVLQFSNPTRTRCTVTIFDFAGKVIRVYNQIQGDNLNIVKKGLSSGIYVFELSVGSNKVRGKLAVK